MDRFTWAIVGGTVALIAVAIAAVLIVRRNPTLADLTTPDGVVRAYVEALETGRPERAWELLGERQQADVPRDEFVRRASGAFRAGREGRMAIEATEVTGDTARVDVSRTYTGGGPPIFGPSSYTNRFTARLERQRGEWRITVPPEDYRYLLDRPLTAPPPNVIVITATPPTPTPLAAAATPPTPPVPTTSGAATPTAAGPR